MSTNLSIAILILLFAALIGAFENAISATGKRAIKRNYQNAIDNVMRILYGTIWVGVILRGLRLQNRKVGSSPRRMAGFGYQEWEDK